MAESGGGSSQGKSGKRAARLKLTASAKTSDSRARRSPTPRRTQATPGRLSPSNDRREKPVEVYRVDGIARRGLIRHVKVVGRPGEWSVYGVDGLKTQVPGRTIEEAVRRARRRFGFHPLTIRRIEADGTFGQPVVLPPPPPREHR